MIWLYALIVVWGVLLMVAVARGGKVFEAGPDKRISAWMLPVTMTALVVTAGGVALCAFETSRLYS